MLTRKLLAEINERPKKSRNLWPLVALGAGVIVLAALLLLSYPLALAILLAGAACVWLVYKRDTVGRTVSLVYDDLDAKTEARFAAVQKACEALAGSEKIWRVAGRREKATKPGSGAAPASDRQRAEVGRLETPGISTNVVIWGIDAGEDPKVFFFPEAVLIYQQERYRAVSYESFEVALSSTRYVEDEEVPEDAEVVGRTWRYTRPDGGPDPRHKPNPQLPVVLYGLLRITGSSELDVRLQVSNRAAAVQFVRGLQAQPGAEERPQEEASREGASRKETSGSGGPKRVRWPAEAAMNGSAYRTLGIADGASMREVSAAYKNLARMYHPDKVAQLAPEVREFAGDKMKEINAAYAELKRRRA